MNEMYLIVTIIVVQIISVHSRNVVYNLPQWIFNSTEIENKTKAAPRYPEQQWKNISTSHSKEDIFAYQNFFYGISNGLVVETGIGQFSSTLFLERIANWKAIHIEADPTVFKQLIHRRSNQVNIHAALCSTSKEVHFVPSKHEAQGIYEFMSSDFLKLWHPHLLSNPKKVEELQTLLCVPVSTLLQKIGIKKVDLWILDEHLGDGSDTDVLKGLDSNQTTIDVITFHETQSLDDNHSKQTEHKVHILEAIGYNCDTYKSGMRWCLHKNFTPSKMNQ